MGCVLSYNLTTMSTSAPRASPPSRPPRWARAGVVAVAVLLSAAAAAVVPAAVRRAYASHGHGDQFMAFAVVLGSFLSPLLWPMLQLKSAVTHVVMPALGVSRWEGPLTTRAGRWLLTPPGDFDPATAPPAPDYDDLDVWSMHPLKPHDASSRNPDGVAPCDPKDCNTCSAFYLHPSTWYTAASWNAPALHPVTSYLSDDAIGPQHANAFNGACRIFAPRYRQMAAAGFLQERGIKDRNSERALALAYSDVARAFAHFLKHHHRGEPIFLAGHSQGALLGEMLLREFFVDEPLARHLGAAYLVGWTIFDGDFNRTSAGLSKTHAGLPSVHVCARADDVACVASWRTYSTWADATAFLHIEPPEHRRDARRVCVNPLTWEAGPNTTHAAKELNLGGLSLMHYTTMFRYLVGSYTTPKERVTPPAVIPHISDAQCVNGNLVVQPPAHWGYGWSLWPFPAWTFASFPNGNLHPYDFNFFYMNLRENVVTRARAWWAEHRGA